MKKFFLFLIFFLVPVLLPGKSGATTVAPTILEISLDPGQSQQAVISLFNETAEPLYLAGSIETFQPDGERGEARVVPPEITDQAVSWVKLPLNALVLAPREVVEVPVFVTVPETAEVGGYYLAIMWQTMAGPNQPVNQVKLSGRVGVLLLLEVKGEAHKELRVEDFRLIEDENFYSSLPVGFSLKLKNEGNIHLKPEGYVMIKNIFGKMTKSLLINEERGNILPASSRRFEEFWRRSDFVPIATDFIGQLRREGKQLAIGRFTAQAFISYDPAAITISSEEVVFWVIPWRLLSLVGGLAFIFLLAIILRKRHRRKLVLNQKEQ
ncbi:MAG TPA: hypothetical protein PKL09_03240 [bacterium]|nr:hypothetical protein [bacterium]HNS34312.1 hypothetical protein [bacterium]